MGNGAPIQGRLEEGGLWDPLYNVRGKGVLEQLCSKKGLMVLFLQPFKGDVSLVPFRGGKQDAVACSVYHKTQYPAQ